MTATEVGETMTEVIHSREEAARRLDRSVVTIGNFDGMHRGHQAIFETAVREASERGATSVGLTFEPHPEAYFSGGEGPARLSPPPHKFELMEACGIDVVVALSFDASIAGASPAAFVEEILVDRLGAEHVVVGRDFRFGKGRAGDTDSLEQLGEPLGMTRTVEPSVEWRREPISSTRIREAIETGDVEAAEAMLGRPYRLSGVVVRGEQRGRKLGFPTANIEPVEQAIPPSGVYVTTLGRAGRQHWQAITNIGTRPTFDGDELTIETFVLDDDVEQEQLELYDEDVELDVHQRLRGEEAFDSPEELVAQIERDVEEARAYFEQEEGDGRQ